MKKIKFIKNPIGAFGLAYVIGEEAELEINQANELVDLKFAVFVEEIEKAEKPKVKTEKAIK